MNERIKLMECPDVEEIQNEMRRVYREIHNALKEIINKNGKNITLNTLIIFIINWSTNGCKNQSEVDHAVDLICKSIKINAQDCEFEEIL